MIRIMIIVSGLLAFNACTSTSNNTKNSRQTENNSNAVESNENNKITSLTADKIAEKTYHKYGAEKIKSNDIYFSFRTYDYSFKHATNDLVRSRSFINDEDQQVTDVWTGDTLIRKINGNAVELTDKKEKAYINSINSVFYFAFLPKAILDPAVYLKLLDNVDIKGQSYYKIQVTFDEEGGGEDHEDVFLYWINTQTFKMDYMAYRYYTEGGGFRFRAVNNSENVAGITFQDYLNYGPKKGEENIGEIFMNADDAYANDELRLVSEIKLENIRVE